LRGQNFLSVNDLDLFNCANRLHRDFGLRILVRHVGSKKIATL